MAVRNEFELKALFETGDTITESSMVDLIDTMFSLTASSGANTDITNGADLQVSAQHFGSAPTLTKLAAADYRIEIPSGSKLVSLTVQGGDDNVNGSSELNLRIKDVDGALYRMDLGQIIAKATNQAQDENLFPVQYNVTAVGEITHIIANLQLGQDGFILIFSPAISFT